MRIFTGRNGIIILMLLLFVLNSCAVNNKIDSFYSIPTISYLREGPNYDYQVVAELYNADKVKLLEKSDDSWWQVQSLRNEKIGWTQRDLLSETPIIAKNYYIIDSSVPLRNSPRQDVMSRNLLDFGDTVKKIAENDGWWRVLVEKDKAIGWVPATVVSEKPPEPPGVEKPKIPEEVKTDATQPAAKLSYYYVAAGSLNLYIIPTIPSQVVKILKLNDKVEKISQAGSEWLKVRYLDTGAEGWAQAYCLKRSPVTDKNQIVTPKTKSQKGVLSPKQRAKQLKSKTLEPEGM